MGRSKRGRAEFRSPSTKLVLASVLAAASPATSQNGCVSLAGSKTCPAFSSASVSTGSYLIGLYPFLRDVTDTASFDEQLNSYVRTSYVESNRYQTLLGCGNINLLNTTNLYARFTTSVICNGIVQNSIQECSLTGNAARPLCADSCADFAQSEALVTSDKSLCSNPNGNSQNQIRADFTNCALPANSLSSSNCIQASDNEPQNCGYSDSTIGICSYCASGGINSTDTCCYNSKIDDRCAGVALPAITPVMTFPPMPTNTNGSTPAPESNQGHNGLSGGAIAGIVIGSVIGLALIAFLVFLCIRLSRRRSNSQKGSVFNQPAPSRGVTTAQSQPISEKRPTTAPQGYEILPGGRIARMSALEGHSGDSPSRHGGSRHGTSRHGLSTAGGAAAAGAAAGYMASRRRGDNHSSSDEFAESPRSETRAGVLRPPPLTSRRNGSLSSGSILIGEDPQSPTSAGGMSGGVASQQSEQLPFFKDYYSQDDIHPGDRVAVLWAYQPRAVDEFALERGHMLKVVGIWDDGWATGVMVDEMADEWEARRQAQRDSGVSNTSGRVRETSPPASGEIKAFPLVCVCLPEHWRKTIEGDGSTEAGSSAHPGSQWT
ncbi:hypothetical protein PG993_002972 [Apiospora rasikravindrae]|uniref:SH3 domain-containing protein n=1 Tax=Apiospora rasikravindrae TaxID=990691 RepID=A0ABR1TYA2_9PEZI